MISETLFILLSLWQLTALPLALAALLWALSPAFRAVLADVWQAFLALRPAPRVEPASREVWIWNPTRGRHDKLTTIDPP